MLLWVPWWEAQKSHAQSYPSQSWPLCLHYKLHVLFTPTQESKVGIGVHFQMRGNRLSERAPPFLGGAQLAGREDLDSSRAVQMLFPSWTLDPVLGGPWVTVNKSDGDRVWSCAEGPGALWLTEPAVCHGPGTVPSTLDILFCLILTTIL